MQPLPTVLLVDDDHAARYLIKRLLRPYADRLRVLTAENGQEALHLLDECAVESGQTLVLLDLNMPVLDGFGFLAAQQALPLARRAIKVVVVSSSEVPDEQRRAAALGIPMVAKPMTAANLARVLHQQLGNAFAA